MASRLEMADAILDYCGLPKTANNEQAMLAWSVSEFGYADYPQMAQNNMMATEYEMAGTTLWNGVGVRNYPTFALGVHALGETLKLGYYDGIRAALAADADPAVTIGRISESPWGSHPSPAILSDVQARFMYVGGLSVGSDAIPGPTPTPSPAPVGHMAMPSIQRGATGEVVSQCQVLCAVTPVDGVFGPVTENAVKFLQGKANMAVDGIVGDKTWTLLTQVRLKCRFHDGIYGAETTEKVRALQEFEGLAVDGIVGPATMHGMTGV